MIYKIAFQFVLWSFLLLYVITGSAQSKNELVERKIKNLSIVSELEKEPIICQNHLSTFYQSVSYLPIWSRSSIEQLIQILGDAWQVGLKPTEYHLERIKILNDDYRRLSPEKRSDLEILASDACLLYVYHNLYGKTDPEIVDCDWFITKKDTFSTPIQKLEEFVELGRLDRALKDIEPQQEIFAGLKTARIEYEKLKKSGGWETDIENGATIKPGKEDIRVKQIRHRLIITGDLDKNHVKVPELYDEELLEAVKRFQQRHGLEVDGKIGKQTIDAMNVPVSERIEQIEANMERCRWLPEDLSSYYLTINIPDFSLKIMKNGELEGKYRVIVGMPTRKTKILNSRMTHLVFNPTWTIPPYILEEDIIPMVAKNPNYLSSRNIKIQDFQGNPIDSLDRKWTIKNAKGFNYVQDPGSGNPLGVVKFLLPNHFFIYLHDTPYRYLFDRNVRAFSSGCVRVENALDLAEYVLKDNKYWDRKRINKVVNPEKAFQTQYVKLRNQPMVYIRYWTAWKDEDGSINFRNDIYDKDSNIILHLDKEPLPLQ